ncbi:MAG: hypothetical protein ACJAT5_001037 [Lentimonas sp.]|jgi:hypothetical protein
MKLPKSAKLKHLPLILGSVIAATSNASVSLIINGDFETGLSGGGYGSYNSEAARFAAATPSNPIVNNSNWNITQTYQAAQFKDFYPASPDPRGWGIKMGRYTNSYVTNTSTMSLEEGDYMFSAKHWGELSDSVGSEFTATLVGIGTIEGVDQMIGTFTDTTRGGVQISSTKFTLPVAGKYQLQLSGSGNLDQTSRAWLDDLTLVDIPEPASIATILGLSALGAVMIRRRLRKDS